MNVERESVVEGLPLLPQSMDHQLDNSYQLYIDMDIDIDIDISIIYMVLILFLYVCQCKFSKSQTKSSFNI